MTGLLFVLLGRSKVCHAKSIVIGKGSHDPHAHHFMMLRGSFLGMMSSM